MTDYVDDELERLSREPGPPPVLSSDRFWEPIHKLLSKKAIGVDIGQTIGDAIDLMREYQYGAVVVTRRGKLAGIVSERDLLAKVIGVFDDF
jgi:CBS domain-containing protein